MICFILLLILDSNNIPNAFGHLYKYETYDSCYRLSVGNFYDEYRNSDVVFAVSYFNSKDIPSTMVNASIMLSESIRAGEIENQLFLSSFLKNCKSPIAKNYMIGDIYVKYSKGLFKPNDFLRISGSSFTVPVDTNNRLNVASVSINKIVLDKGWYTIFISPVLVDHSGQNIIAFDDPDAINILID